MAEAANEKQVAEKRDAALKRALSTPPKPKKDSLKSKAPKKTKLKA